MGLDLTGIGSVADLAKSLVDRFLPPSMSEAQKAQKQLELQELLQRREDAVLEAKKAIMVAELQQGDAYTKRARPSVIYAGLAFIGINHVLLPLVGYLAVLVRGEALPQMPSLSLPAEFWMAWGGICTTWVIARSAERRGIKNKLINLITGGAS